ncbi:low affinity iron permease family protein [Dongia deserti]|uniref:low affinity iron permease family protein n=1 Tax=Dongia deserti TaxID=2268030 RepID=UPI000E65DA30|nr:low affinity iron permease family protein [Dongia deserti]
MSFFDRAAAHIARLVGHPFSFALACLIVIVWAGLGPIAGYSDTWQLIINTSTTIVTFLMVFLIQNTQNRDNHALHLKIDELLRALDAADTRLVDLEERSEQELQQLHDRYRELANGAAVEKEKRDESRPKRQAGSDAGERRRNQGPRRRVQEPKA